MRIGWTTRARQDLLNIYTHIAPRNPTAARRMQEVIRSKVGALETSPRMGRAGRVDGTRELVVTGTPYVVAYRIVSENIQILRVIHGARDWPEGLP